MTDHVDKLAEAISRARIENTCFSEGPGEVDDHALARAVLLHLRDAPSDRDFDEVRAEVEARPAFPTFQAQWRTMFDRMRPAEPCPHEWGDTLDDDHQQTCQKCGATRGVAHGE